MKNVKLVKNLFIVIVSFALVLWLAQSSFVLAAEDENLFDYEPITANNTASNEVDNNTAGNNTIGNNTAGNNTAGNISGNISNNSSVNNTPTNRNISNSNTLADTGISNVGGIITLIVVVCGISAIYSYKKVDEYRKL